MEFSLNLVSTLFEKRIIIMAEKLMLMQSETPTVEQCFDGQDIEFISEITSNTVDNYILNKRSRNTANQITINL